MMWKRLTAKISLAICLTALIVGCSNGNMKTAVVKGKITFNGKAVPIGTISFVPEGNKPAATGQIQKDGSYELSTYGDGDGAVLGKHTVMIIAVDAQEGALPEDKNPVPPAIIPDKYFNNQTSGLTANVEDKVNEINFELKGDLSTGKKKGR